MATASGTSFVKTRRMQGFASLLTSAACEWFLIFLLLGDAVLLYLLTKFAKYCQLQAPCLLCSRLDCIFGGENTEFYQHLFCSNHRSEISTSISCYIHGKVANGHGMCDDRLLPHVQSQSHLKNQNTDMNLSCDPLCHLGYTELKLTSESDFPFSNDDDDEGSMFHENNEASYDPIAQFASASLQSDLNPENPKSNSPNPMPLLLDPDISKHTDVNKFLGSDAFDDLDLGGINLHKRTPSEETVDVTQSTSTGLVFRKPEEDLEKISRSGEASIETEPIVSESTLGTTSPRQGNSSNLSKFPVTTKKREITSFAIEQPSIEEGLKLLASHICSPRGSNVSSFDPTNHVLYPEIQSEASSSNGRTQVLHRSVSVESYLESLDGSNVCGIEGESTVDILKRQIEYDKKCINALYKELEEERNAAAVAANQAMAMITRLQEEKAALQMEALQ